MLMCYHRLVCGLLLILQSVTWISAADPTGEIARRYHSDGPAHSFQKYLRRWHGPDEFQPWNVEYRKGEVYYMIPGIGMAVILFIFSITFFIGRFCCNTCGGRYPKVHGYTYQQRWRPFWIAVVASAIIAGFCGYIIYASYRTHQHSDTAIIATYDLMNDVTRVLNTTTTTMSITNNAVNGVSKHITSTITTIPSFTTSSLITSLSEYQHDYASSTIMIPSSDSSISITLTCSICISITSHITSITHDITSYNDTYISSTINAINHTLIRTATWQQRLQTTNDVLNRTSMEILHQFDHANDLISYVNGYEKYRYGLILATSILLIFPFFLIPYAQRKRSPHPYRLTYLLLIITSILIWIWFSLHLVITSITSDMCIYIDTYEPQLENVMDDDVAAIFSSCLVAIPLSQAMNLTTTIPNINIIPSHLNITSLISWQQEIQQENAITGWGWQDDTDMRLNELNSLISPDVVTRMNITNLNSTSTSYLQPNTSTAYQHVLLSISVTSFVGQQLSQIQSRLTTIINDAKQLNNTIDTAQSTLSSLSPSLTTLSSLPYTLSSLDCSTVGSLYLYAKQEWCNHTLSPLSYVVMCLFIIGVIICPLLYLTLILSKRVHHPYGSGPYLYEENVLEEIAMDQDLIFRPSVATPNDKSNDSQPLV